MDKVESMYIFAGYCCNDHIKQFRCQRTTSPSAGNLRKYCHSVQKCIKTSCSCCARYHQVQYMHCQSSGKIKQQHKSTEQYKTDAAQ